MIKLSIWFFLAGKIAAIAAVILFLMQTRLAEASPSKVLPDPAQDIVETGKIKQTVVLAGGCFWGVEAVYRHTKGVLSAISGYAGGKIPNPSYTQVSTGRSGHAEVVQVVYDPRQISYGQLLKIYFSVAHDPTQLNFQGPDHGTQYRSAIFTTSDEQARVARSYIAQLQQAKLFNAPIVTEVTPLPEFYQAEDHHQNYVALHPTQPYIVYNDLPKVENLRMQFPALYR